MNKQVTLTEVRKKTASESLSFQIKALNLSKKQTRLYGSATLLTLQRVTFFSEPIFEAATINKQAKTMRNADASNNSMNTFTEYLYTIVYLIIQAISNTRHHEITF